MTAYPNPRGANADPKGDFHRLRPAQSRQLVALTNDQALIKALRELPGADHIVVHIVADLRALSDELLQNSGAVALIDATALDAPVDGAVDAIATQFPDLRLMVAGHGAEQNLLSTRIADQSVFRFVHKPASPQRLRLFLDAAARSPDDTTRSMRALDPQPIDVAAQKRTDGGGRSPLLLGVIALVVIATLAGAAWFLWLQDRAGTAAAKVAGAPTQVASPEVLALIQRADQAFADKKYVGLDGGSAAELYRDALRRQPANDAARKGFDRSVDAGMRRAEEALLAGQLNDAAVVAEALRMIAPDNPRLNFLNAQLEKEQARINADATQRAAAEARQTQIRAELDQMAEKMHVGALLDPADDSAVFHFRAAETLWPGDPMVRNSRENLVAALLTAADNELTAHHLAAARKLVETAATLNSGAPGLDILRRRVEEMSVQQQSPAAAEPATAPPAPRAEVALTAKPEVVPAPPPATAPVAAAPVAAPAPPPADKTAAADAVVSATTLQVQRKFPPEYPQQAREQGVSGWVEMEFTVATDGSVKDVVVTASEPGRVFDSAAVAAMRRFRYAPVIRNGQPVTQRARLRMRFTFQDGQ